MGVREVYSVTRGNERERERGGGGSKQYRERRSERDREIERVIEKECVCGERVRVRGRKNGVVRDTHGIYT